MASLIKNKKTWFDDHKLPSANLQSKNTTSTQEHPTTGLAESGRIWRLQKALYGQAYLLKSVTGAMVVENVLNFINHNGLPLKITCDQGTEFKNKDLEDLCRLYKIELHFGTSKNSNSNSPVERFHSTLIEHYRCIKQENKQLTPEQIIRRALLGYNNSIHSVTKFTPFEIIKGHINGTNPFDLSDHVNKDDEDNSNDPGTSPSKR
ncbi:hypothetical protein D910_09013 [Dendroctonus ponderosae]|uniref:Integrase catalytic domain-containing protein n=1 Tax=Dendroctonus ponderosae TaxID=77166 RepID=U4UNF6_DENPD|nr:hypothetical protein D910_09013 [Dendroctonus ponderosae]